jgi:tRNA threonylcarbamoyladenosine biosynthesis protein TsaE
MNADSPVSQFPQSWEFEAASEAETDKLGRSFAESLKPGLVVNLVGNLGAGKTRLVQFVASALGIDRSDVTSPTFVLHQRYVGNRLEIHHFDAYRLRDSDEFIEFGGHEILDSPVVSFVEWGDRIGDLLPRDHLRIEIEPTGETARKFRFQASGTASVSVLNSLRSRVTDTAE